ncbi:MAG: hypothetical protein IPG07_19990 [Crocinitomicaceae bacterium]|nr:hypothetical protein [Crocinitomicaceae bacterium]
MTEVYLLLCEKENSNHPSVIKEEPKKLREYLVIYLIMTLSVFMTPM